MRHALFISVTLFPDSADVFENSADGIEADLIMSELAAASSASVLFVLPVYSDLVYASVGASG